MPQRGPRDAQAGVTLVEVLVVLVLIGVMAGVVGLSLGPVDRGGALDREANLLVARLNRAADEALLANAPVAFVWTRNSYAFLTLQQNEWATHPLPALGTPHDIGGGLQFSGGRVRWGALCAAGIPHPGTGATTFAEPRKFICAVPRY